MSDRQPDSERAEGQEAEPTQVPGSAAGAAAPPDAPEPVPLDLEPTNGSRTPYMVVAGGLVAAVVILGAVALVISSKGSGYSSEDQQKFMAACTAGGGESVRSACGCIYDQMAAKVPYDRFVSIDSELEKQRSAGTERQLNFPAEVETIRADCVARTKPVVKEPPPSN